MEEEKNIIKIPRKIVKKVEWSPRGCLKPKLHHYEYVESSKNVVIYKCIENGVLECFQKNDFLVNKGAEEIDPFEYKPKNKEVK